MLNNATSQPSSQGLKQPIATAEFPSKFDPWSAPISGPQTTKDSTTPCHQREVTKNRFRIFSHDMGMGHQWDHLWSDVLIHWYGFMAPVASSQVHHFFHQENTARRSAVSKFKVGQISPLKISGKSRFGAAKLKLNTVTLQFLVGVSNENTTMKQGKPLSIWLGCWHLMSWANFWAQWCFLQFFRWVGWKENCRTCSDFPMNCFPVDVPFVQFPGFLRWTWVWMWWINYWLLTCKLIGRGSNWVPFNKTLRASGHTIITN